MSWILSIGAVLFFLMGFIGLATLLGMSFSDEELKPESKKIALGVIAFSLAASVALGWLAWFR